MLDDAHAESVLDSRHLGSSSLPSVSMSRLVHNLLTGVGDRVVTLMRWYLNPTSVFASENIVCPIAFIVDIPRSHQGTHAAIFVIRLQVLAIRILVVIVIQQVVRSSPLILLASIELILFDIEHLCLLCFRRLHVFKSVDLSVVPFFAEVSPSVLNVLVLLLTDLLICDGEVLVEALLLGDEVARGRVRVVHLGRVDVFVVTACALAKPRILNQLLVFHGRLTENEQMSDHHGPHESRAAEAVAFAESQCVRITVAHVRLSAMLRRIGGEKNLDDLLFERASSE